MKTKIYNKIIISLLIAVSVLFIYGEAVTFDFINFDDNIYVTGNTHIQNGLTKESLSWAVLTTTGGIWHPITWISYMIDFKIYGMNSGGFHFTNIILHLLNSILIFFCIEKMTSACWRSGMVAFLFAVHPLHIESVAWVAERKDVLSTFFALLTIWSYIKYTETSKTYNYLLIILFFILAGMSKSMVVTLPFMLMLFDYWPLKRIHNKYIYCCSENEMNGNISLYYLIYEKIPLIILSILLCIITFVAHQKEGGLGSVKYFPVTLRIAHIFIYYAAYLEKMAFPRNLGILYPYIAEISILQLSGAVAVFGSISFLAARYRKEYPWIFVGWLWYIVTLMPVIGIFKIGFHSIADRYTYIPSVGIFIILSWSISYVYNKILQRRIILFIISAYCSFLILSSKEYIHNWRDSISIFTHTLNVTVDNYFIHTTIADAFVKSGKNEEAAWHYKQAVRINPDFQSSYINYGALLLKKDKNEFISFSKETIKKKPYFLLVRYNLALTLIELNKIDEAYLQIQEILKIDPDYADAYYCLAIIMKKKGNKEQAVFFYRKALHLNPNIAEKVRAIGKNGGLKQ